jgi:hypothetical protein
VQDENPTLDLMREQNLQAIKNIRTEWMKMRILEQQERDREGVQEETSDEEDVPLFVRPVTSGSPYNS